VKNKKQFQMFSIGKKVIAKNQPKKPAKLTFEQQLANFIEYQKKHEQEQQDESDEEVPVPEEDKKTESKGLEKLHLPRGGKSVSVQPELVKENPCVSCQHPSQMMMMKKKILNL